MNRQIGPFILDESKTTMKYGKHFKALLDVPFDNEQRIIRLWLPDDYDGNKRFPVLYFSDGQNLVNGYLTAYGDWGLDKVWKDLYDKYHISFILVGIDCPSYYVKRENELNPPFLPTTAKHINNPLGDLYIDYICDTLKPIIDKTLLTLPDKAHTAICGSSMGGIMAFYAGVRRKDVFSFALCFSPAFLLYTKNKWDELLHQFDLKPENKVKFFFYVGGIGFEHKFIKSTFRTYDYMKSIGFSDDEVALIFDSNMEHNEIPWHKYAGDAIYYWLKDK